MEDATKEERTYINADAIGGEETKLGGKLIVRFTDGANTCFKSVSAHIVKKVNDDCYIALTTRTNLRYAPSDGGEYEVKDGVFFLQRAEGSYLAKFYFKPEGITHLNPNFEFAEGSMIDSTGDNISAIKLFNPKVTEGKVIPEVPELVAIDNGDFGIDTEFTIMGYPEETVVVDDDGKVSTASSKFKMYTSSGVLQSQNELIAKCDFLASKGQNGGGVTFKGENRLFAIYTACIEDAGESKKLGYCTRITEKITDLVDNIEV